MPPFFATLSTTLIALLHKDVLVIAWMDIFNSNQKKFIFNLLLERSARTFVCFVNGRSGSLAITDHLIIDVNNMNDVQLNVPLKYSIKRIDGQFIELNKVDSLWIPTGRVYDSLFFKGGCIPRRPPEVNYLEELFGKEATLVYEILDELFNNMPLSLSIFLNILKAVTAIVIAIRQIVRMDRVWIVWLACCSCRFKTWFSDCSLLLKAWRVATSSWRLETSS